MQATQSIPALSIVAERAPHGVVVAAVRRSEWVILAFQVYAALIGCLLPVASSVRYRVLLINLFVILAYAVLIRADFRRPRLALSVARDWLPLALVLLAYREMGWFALPQRDHLLESRFLAWDHAFLGAGIKTAIESLGPFLPSVLEIAYALVYTLAPFAVALLYVLRRRDSVDRFLLIFVSAVLLSYSQFPFWPSQPPRTLFPADQLPLYDTVFRRFNLWMLGSYGIHTSVFPSAHVAGAFSAAFGLREALPAARFWSRMLLIIAVFIAFATVYGRYHYLADAAAGLLLATAVPLFLKETR